MTTSFVSPQDALQALRVTLPALVGAIRGSGDPDARAIGEWSIRDVASHLVDVAEDHQNVARGRGTAVSSSTEISDYNRAKVRARGQLDLSTLADMYEAEMDRYLDYLAQVDDDPVLPWADIKIPLSALISLDIAEMLMHGFDITQAEGRPWHIDPHHAALAGRGISPVTMHYVDKEAAAGLDACFDLRLRGEWKLHFVFRDGELSIEEPTDRRVDVHISADPVAFMLVGYGRISQWGPIAKGQIVTWGRRPWLAFRFGSLLRNP